MGQNISLCEAASATEAVAVGSADLTTESQADATDTIPSSTVGKGFSI